MILQALTRYYRLLAEDGRLPKPGYGPAKVSFALNLSPSGELMEIFPLVDEEKRGKKTVELPQKKTVPEQPVRSSGVHAFFLCDTSSYFLGRDMKGKPQRSLECFAASRKLHERVLKNAASPAARAVLGFFRSWDPQKAEENAAFRAHQKEVLAGGFLIFQLDGGRYAQDDPELQAAWEAYRASEEKGVRKRCLVTGEIEPVAMLHPKIKGVAGAQSSGANLVSFNSDVYESYGNEKSKGLNAPVGEPAAFAYGTALNNLLADRDHRLSVGDTTVVYWAESPNPVYRNIFAASLDPQNEDDDKLLTGVMRHIAEGKPVADGVDLKMPFYILGLAPNAARISVRFFFRNSFGGFLQNLSRHYTDLKIVHGPQEFEYLTPYWLLRETVNPNSSDKSASPQLSGEVMSAILTGQPYPQSLQSAVLLRIRAEQDDPDKHIQKITRGRAAILKAFLLRMNRNLYKEVSTVALNENSDNRAYVLGRLFAALEKTQEDANRKAPKVTTPPEEKKQNNAKTGINSTIKDRFFTSACSTPGSVFSTLFKLYVNHIGKIRKTEGDGGIYVNDEKLVGGLLDKLDVENNPFPAHLSLNDQSIFVLGYYQQVQSFFTPKAQKQTKEED